MQKKLIIAMLRELYDDYEGYYEVLSEWTYIRSNLNAYMPDIRMFEHGQDKAWFVIEICNDKQYRTTEFKNKMQGYVDAAVEDVRQKKVFQ
ncbi:hypothetical protein [Streptococcus pneumoniae]|uniref:hypothetical protein n=1 Tax=Streptococcus pneumoniae TaxID=1313 RepID=UPI00344F1A3B